MFYATAVAAPTAVGGRGLGSIVLGAKLLRGVVSARGDGAVVYVNLLLSGGGREVEDAAATALQTISFWLILTG